MGAQLAGKSNGRGKRRSYSQLSEINVTPFVDVMLVLLIVFMVSAPLMTVGVPVDLPKTAAPSLPADNKPLFISIDTQNRIYVQETQVELDNLVPLLRAITENNPEARVLVRGDAKIAVRHHASGHGHDQRRRVHQGRTGRRTAATQSRGTITACATASSSRRWSMSRRS